jgi:mannose-6-phosphate isomerase-like protein (cupin superfamily)
MPRLVVIDDLPNGTSAVTEDANLKPFWRMADGLETTELWYLNKSPPTSSDPRTYQEKFDFNLSPGTVRFGHSTFSPFTKVQACAEKHGLVTDETTYGKHNTATIDFLVVTKGQLDLVTENGVVHLKAGDCIVQKATVHAWINPGDEVAEMVYVMIGAHTPANFKPTGFTTPVPLKMNYPPQK